MVVISISAIACMGMGLELAGYKRWQSYKEGKNVEHFKAWFGAKPISCEKIWVDLQTTTNEEARIKKSANPLHLLLALHFLKAYPTEKKFAAIFSMSEVTVRKWSSLYIRKLQLLKSEKVSTGTALMTHD